MQRAKLASRDNEDQLKEEQERFAEEKKSLTSHLESLQDSLTVYSHKTVSSIESVTVCLLQREKQMNEQQRQNELTRFSEEEKALEDKLESLQTLLKVAVKVSLLVNV